jgi:hypothetical protein
MRNVKWCKYHSDEWKDLIEQGWVTEVVESDITPEGIERWAKMVAEWYE